jgi:hypothetical protein
VAVETRVKDAETTDTKPPLIYESEPLGLIHAHREVSLRLHVPKLIVNGTRFNIRAELLRGRRGMSYQESIHQLSVL